MIGIVSSPKDEAVIREFFELFKIPWEFYRSSEHYEALIYLDAALYRDSDTPLNIVYAPGASSTDQKVASAQCYRVLHYREAKLPIYGKSTVYSEAGGVLRDVVSGLSAIEREQKGRSVLVRLGYDLVSEVRSLLTAGQPAEHADSPTLDLHIAVLRDLLSEYSVRFVEVPPVPEGYRFIACLTHDVDHPLMKIHKFDHTMFGFLFRAVVGSCKDLVKGRTNVSKLLKNWLAAIKAPLVFIGLAKDPWAEFDKDYDRIEGDLPSTYFFIPFGNRCGRTKTGSAPEARASGYSLSQLRDQISRMSTPRHEIGVHGIDAWADTSSALEEVSELRSAVGGPVKGVRMHWLYFDEQSPAALDKAGLSYDSTVGYNQTVGYRAGTGQVYKPLNSRQLLELPLHVMDTALFYPAYLNLAPSAARKRISSVIENAVQFGGVVTLNWHDRSLAPERLWGDTYAGVIDELKQKGAWFATADQVVSWFRLRRDVTFRSSQQETTFALSRDSHSPLPALCLKVNEPNIVNLDQPSDQKCASAQNLN